MLATNKLIMPGRLESDVLPPALIETSRAASRFYNTWAIVSGEANSP